MFTGVGASPPPSCCALSFQEGQTKCTVTTKGVNFRTGLATGKWLSFTYISITTAGLSLNPERGQTGEQRRGRDIRIWSSAHPPATLAFPAGSDLASALAYDSYSLHRTFGSKSWVVLWHVFCSVSICC